MELPIIDDLMEQMLKYHVEAGLYDMEGNEMPRYFSEGFSTHAEAEAHLEFVSCDPFYEWVEIVLC